MQVIRVLLLISLVSISSVANAIELNKSFKLFTKNCLKQTFDKSLKKLKRDFYLEKNKLSDEELLKLRNDEQASGQTNIMWNLLRTLYPYQIPKSFTPGKIYMHCYLYFDKFLKSKKKSEFKKWEICLIELYNGKLPKFEKKLLSCFKKIY